MDERSLSADTQAILLLCGELGRRTGADLKPLGPKQFSAVAKWLEAQGLRAGDLLTQGVRERMGKAEGLEVPAARIEPLLDRSANLGLVSERWERAGIWVISRADAGYPERLARYLGPAAPPLLYGIGERKPLNRGGLAVVGSRDRGDEDGDFARRVGEQCAREGIVVISGAAKGIDRDAMNGAIESGGAALGVLAEGVLKPAISPELREPIANGLVTLISSYDPDARWFTHTAMDRNKFLYGLSDAALVVSSGEESGGTWAGAVEALKAGRARVYVKASGALAPGNSRLMEAGGAPFPAEPWTDIRALLKPVAKAEAKVEPASHPLESADAYTLVIAEMMRAMTAPQPERALAERFQVRGVQMKDWLKRAVAEGRIRKSRKPAGYVAVIAEPLSENLSLFD